VPGQLTKDQQKCVNEMNKNGERVNKAQLKENEWCLQRFQSEKLGPQTTFDFDQCLTADVRDKVQKAKAKTRAQEEKKCESPLPAFGYTGAATVNDAAMNAGLWMNYILFGGPPVSDGILATNAQDSRDEARCQLEMLKRADKLENTVLKELNKAKRQALKEESVDSSDALRDELVRVFSSNRKIRKDEEMLADRVDKKCESLAAPSTIFPGIPDSCGIPNPDWRQAEDCAIAAARCEACLKINAFDDLDLDCDAADDLSSNDSCGD